MSSQQITSSLDATRSTAKWLQLLMSMSCNTMAFSITPYFASDAKHDFFMGETQIGLVFAAFPMGYMMSCGMMSLANISHLKMSTLTLWIRGFVLAFVAFSVMFGLTPTILNAQLSTDSEHFVALHHAIMFGCMRCLQGLTVAVLDVLILLYITKLFPDQVSAVVGQKEAVMGLGVVFGPPLGGGLYSAGGFEAPPMVTGAIVFIIAAVTQVVLLRSVQLKELHALREVPIALVKGQKQHHSPARTQAALGGADSTLNSEATSLLPTPAITTTINASASDVASSRVFFSDQRDDESSGPPINDQANGNHDDDSNADSDDNFDASPEFSPVTLQNLLDLFRLLPLYATLGPCCISVLSIACFAFLESMVPLYALDTYGVEAWGIGVTMGGAAVVYAASAITIGTYLSPPARKYLRPWVLAISSILLAFGMLLIAPSFHVIDMRAPNTIHNGYAVTVTGILLCCSAMAVIAVVAVALLVDEARSTSLVLVPTAAAVASFGMSLGGFIGPVVGSALAEVFGFPIAFFAFSCAAVVLGAVFVVLVVLSPKSGDAES